MNLAVRSALFAFFCLLPYAQGCVNEFQPTQVAQSFGEFIGRFRPHSQKNPGPSVGLGMALIRVVDNPPKADWESRAAQLRAVLSAREASETKQGGLQKTDEFTIRADLAAALLHLGRTREAIQILEPLAKEHPWEYRLIATLGTAYELDGQLNRALEYISRGIELNAQSHEGTEWLHSRILKAKLEIAKNPKWLNAHSVLGYDFGDPPRFPPEFRTDDHVARVLKAIGYQLNERLQFVLGTDPIVADLLNDASHIFEAAGKRDVAQKLSARAASFKPKE